ncbi:MAG: chromate transporter [Acholeplasmataceae bacterium]|nr:chromate transporter [Acholeplasmataceae bacterium]
MIELILVFLYVGLFTIGGGMVAIPLIQQQVVDRGLISIADFYAMVAIAESTPGPIGINVATYVGFELFSFVGALVATTAFILPSFLIVSFLAGLLKKYRQSLLVIHWFYYVKAAIVGLIGYALIKVVFIAFISYDPNLVIDWKAVILFIVLLGAFYFLKKIPWLVILLGAILGMIIL